MSIERVLDIGIDSGGDYIKKNTAPNERRVGIDRNKYFGSYLKNEYDVLPVVARAQALPFREDTFSRIEMLFPFDDIIVPGLERAPGWYQEFQRVLKPHGEIIIFGDYGVHPPHVLKASSQYFNVENVQQLTKEEVEELGTGTTYACINDPNIDFEMQHGSKWEEDCVKINLRSKKSL